MARHLDVEVELQMFGNGVIRHVKVPYEEIENADSLTEILARTYHWGQNDVQPLEDRVSVSAGDIIRWSGKRHLVLGPFQFEEITDPAFPRTHQDLWEKLLVKR